MTGRSAEQRFPTLDIIRGFAVMGILAMNIVAFAMPLAAYVNPMAYGVQSTIDYASYAFSFVLIDGKMRGLFSFLFGASMLLVIEKAEAKGENSTKVHFRRQLWLLLFGAIHFYLIWYGDILLGYALIGMVAWVFHRMSPRALLVWGGLMILIQFSMMVGATLNVRSLAEAVSQPGASAEALRSWNEMSSYVRIPTSAELAEQIGLILGPWTGVVREQLTTHRFDPLIFTAMFGPETLAYMLFGMAALKTGFLTGQWSDRQYARVATYGFAITIPLYFALVILNFENGFSVPALFGFTFAGTVLLRPVMIAAFAALVILLARPGGWLTERVAATGRAAFTNYLGTSILMTGLFYGWGLSLFGELSRAQLWLVVIPMWLLMLSWSKPWLDRFQYGPFEWLWRSLARWEAQPFRKRA